ncbi:MAG: N-6 DNA methylase [Myxococcota bacterium]|jgi:hypothetical protein|nr:N-6 DNA methylase [Myxococcota bacterium]
MDKQAEFSELLQLANRSLTEAKQFEEFCGRLRSTLARSGVGGRPLPLARYLAERAAAAHSGDGDESAVVDPLMADLLAALGFSREQVAYNRPLALSERAVPDYTVRLPELYGTVPVLVVEDKATSVRDFDTRRRGYGGVEESPLEQLRRYVRSGAVHGMAGLLCNGWVLEGWEFGDRGPVCLVRIDLQALAELSLAAPVDFPGKQRTALRALWDRFSLLAFMQAQDFARHPCAPPQLPQPVVDQLQEALRRPNPGPAIEQIILEHHEAHWRAQAIDVASSPDLLVESLRGLIELFAEDVEHQLLDALERQVRYEVQLQQAEQRADLAHLRQQVELHRSSFDLTPEEYRELFLDAVDDFCRRPQATNLAPLVKGWVGSIADRVRKGTVLEEVQLGGLDLGGDQSAVATSGANGRSKNGGAAASQARRVLQSLGEHTIELCRAALELYLEREELAGTFASANQTTSAYRGWVRKVSSSVMVGAVDEKLHREFARQTAYVYLIRLLLVRICEDKGLLSRKLSDGGLYLWAERMDRYLDYASGRSYDYLTRMAFESAQSIYVHFYGASSPFDWYRMDEKMLVRALTVLNVFDLAKIDSDIIGAVYGRFLTEGKHEQGRYYTPPTLVQAMLDQAGFVGPQATGKRLADLACGSGSFLVEACRRLIATFRDGEGRIPDSSLPAVLAELQRSLYGVDLNPFACYLAETNLLIQVLDLLRQAQTAGLQLNVERFAIHCADSLLVDEAIAGADSRATTVLLGREEAEVELLKARHGPFSSGFDVLLGNPPYVRADEEATEYLKYRRLLEGQEWFTTRHQKWDLYVPFIEQYHRLLADGLEARSTLITIESLSTAPYATKLRELLARQSTLHEIVFAQKLKLFKDAAWQSNLIFTFSRGAPPAGHQTRRTTARGLDDQGRLQLEPLDSLVQAETDPDTLFSCRAQVEVDLDGTVPWERLCYVSVGMVLNSDEKIAAGQIVDVPACYDPLRFSEELVEDRGADGKRVRHQAFLTKDLLASSPDAIHRRPFVGSREVLRGGIGPIQWLEYGEGTRCPYRVRRPTFPELYDRPKVMFGTFTGVAVDDGSVGAGQYLVVPDSVRVAVRWCRLAEVDNRALSSARKELAAAFDPALSDGVSEEYLCALALSAPLQSWLAANRRSMKDHVYPDDIKRLPVKLIPLAEQQPFVDRVQELHRLWRELGELQQRGYALGEPPGLPVWAEVARFLAEHPRLPALSLLLLQARQLVRIEPDWLERDLRRARAVGAEVKIGRDTVARPGEAIQQREAVADLLARLCAALPAPWADRQDRDRLPATEEGLLALARHLAAAQAAVEERQQRLQVLQQELDELAWALYRPKLTTEPA